MLVTYRVESRATGATIQFTFNNIRNEEEGLRKLKYAIRDLRKTKSHAFRFPLDAYRGLQKAITFISGYDLKIR